MQIQLIKRINIIKITHFKELILLFSMNIFADIFIGCIIIIFGIYWTSQVSRKRHHTNTIQVNKNPTKNNNNFYIFLKYRLRGGGGKKMYFLFLCFQNALFLDEFAVECEHQVARRNLFTHRSQFNLKRQFIKEHDSSTPRYAMLVVKCNF